jgi:hypothetical protein
MYRKGQRRSHRRWSRERIASAGASDEHAPWAVSCCSLLNNLHGRRGAAEVCKWVQLSSGSAVYPVRHDVLCLLSACGHDEDRVDPSAGLPRARLGVLDRAPGLRQGPLRALREAYGVVHLPVVRRIERVLSASHRHSGGWPLATGPRGFFDSPRLVTPISSPPLFGASTGILAPLHGRLARQTIAVEDVMHRQASNEPSAFRFDFKSKACPLLSFSKRQHRRLRYPLDS